MQLEPGFHRGVSKEAYMADPTVTPSLSASIAKLLINRSPSHAWSAHPKGGRFRGESSEAMQTGSLFDSLMMGGDTEYVVLPAEMPDSKGKPVPTNGKYQLASARAWRDEQLAAGRLPVDPDELKYAKSAVETIRENLARDGVILDGENQLTAIWDEGDVRCKGRFDHWKPGGLIVYDLKVVECAHPEAVSRKCIDYGWDIQGAAYTRAAEAITGEAGRVRFVMLAVEPKPPHAVLVRPFAGTMRALGEWKWKRAVELWGECLRSRKFPGYSGMEAGLEAPQYAMVKMEEGLAGGSVGVPF